MARNSTTWDPGQYLAFASHRLRPALELLQRVPLSAPETIVDLGCGTGNVTEYLKTCWPQADITGVDSSPEMLDKAREANPKVTWQEADLNTWQPDAPVDLVYSNAALHWLGGHDVLFPRLMEMLTPGGVLAAQMPANFNQPSHTSMNLAARNGPWAKTLTPLERGSPVSEPGFYYGLLAPRASQLDIWETRYLQVLQGENPVAEFTKGTWLRPMLDALEEPLRSGFENEYRRIVLGHYPQRVDGNTLFPFTRMFIIAVKPS